MSSEKFFMKSSNGRAGQNSAHLLRNGAFEERALGFQISSIIKTKLVWERKTLEQTKDIEIC